MDEKFRKLITKNVDNASLEAGFVMVLLIGVCSFLLFAGLHQNVPCKGFLSLAGVEYAVSMSVLYAPPFSTT